MGVSVTHLQYVHIHVTLYGMLWKASADSEISCSVPLLYANPYY